MATQTPNYDLRKPAAGDLVNVTTDLSDNFDAIDSALALKLDSADVPDPANTVVSGTSFGQSATGGVAATYSRSDHAHGTPTQPSGHDPSDTVVAETTFGVASTAGASTQFSRADHTHGTPTNPVTAHEADTTSIHGIADTSVLETTTGSAAKITTHEGGADPHPGYVLESLIDAKGDLIVGTAADTVGRLAVGTDTHILTADSAQAGGVKWAAPAAGGITGQGAGTNSVLVGDSATASADQSVALGDFSFASGDGGISIGSGVNTASAAQTSAQGAIAIGVSNNSGINGSLAQAVGAIAIGSGDASVTGAIVGSSGTASIAIGKTALASGGSNVAIGNTASTGSQIGSVAVGAFAQSTSTQTIAVGGGQNTTSGPLANSQGGIAIGASGGSAIAGARASAASSVAIGSGTASVVGASAAHANAIALGSGVATTNTSQLNIGAARMIGGAPNSAAADADLIASQWTAYLNEAGNTLVFKVKYAGGTVKTGTVALT